MTLSKIVIESANKLGSLPGYVNANKQKAGVIVIQEWWGVNEQIKNLGETWFSDFSVVVPDLYRGKLATDHETAGHYFKDLNWEGAVQDIQGAADYLHANGVEKVGVVGFCMGGALAIAASVLANGLHAAAPFYGIPGKDFADPSKAKIPLQCHFALKDKAANFSDPEAFNALEKVLKESNRDYEFYRYDADHGFANETKERYDKPSADLARERVVEFFKKKLN